jgi:hypothetical protein
MIARHERILLGTDVADAMDEDIMYFQRLPEKTASFMMIPKSPVLRMPMILLSLPARVPPISCHKQPSRRNWPNRRLAMNSAILNL